MKYEDLRNIPIGSVIHYTEYTLDIHERLKLVGEISGTLVLVIPAGTKLSAEEIKTYYHLSSIENVPNLSCLPNDRVVLQVGIDNLNIPIYTTVNLNKYFMETGQQVLDYIEQQAKPQTPSQILGFGAYDVGQKFKM